MLHAFAAAARPVQREEPRLEVHDEPHVVVEQEQPDRGFSGAHFVVDRLIALGEQVDDKGDDVKLTRFSRLFLLTGELPALVTSDVQILTNTYGK